MSPLIPLTLFGWLPFVLFLFLVCSRRRAVAWAFSLGWCFLPVSGFAVVGLPDYTKTTATICGVLLGTLFVHGDRLLRFRPKLLDIPIAVWCLCPIASSLTNDLGLYDGVAAALDLTITWGVPYFIGRIHFDKLSDLEDFVLPVIACAVLYIPLCLYEVRMSPQLHSMVYGFGQHSFAQTYRGGGWRPMVFMNHGLQLGMWMGTAVLFMTAWCLFARRKTIMLFGLKVPSSLVLVALAVVFLLVKSTGAIALVGVGILLMLVGKLLKSPYPILLLPCLCLMFLGLRSTSFFDSKSIVELASIVSKDRSESLGFRFDNEDLLLAKASKRLAFGWGGWGRARVYDENGKDISVTDGLWIITLGNYGLLGITSLYATMLLAPSFLAWRCHPGKWKRDPDVAIGASVAVACILAVADSFPNAMQIPAMTLAIGIAAGVCSRREELPQSVRTLGSRVFDPVPTFPMRRSNR